MTPAEPPRPLGSLRGQLMRWLLVPLGALVLFNAFSVYRYAVEASDAAYDRTLLASSRALAEGVSLVDGRVTIDVSFAALDVFENDTPGQMFYAVTGIEGEFVSGYDDFPRLPPGVPRSEAYPALVHFHTGVYRGRPVRIAALWQPVFDEKMHGMALVQVGETLDARRLLARRMLVQSIWPQLALVAAVAVLMALAVRRGLAPLRQLTAEVGARPPTDLTSYEPGAVHREVRPLVLAMNRSRSRLSALLASQRRFVADAAHQLRTPLALLRTQAEVGLRASRPEDLREALRAVHSTVERASHTANQLLSLARVGHASSEEFGPVDLAALVRETGLQLGPAAVRKRIDLAFEGSQSALVRGDAVLLHELASNLLDNAIRYTPEGGTIVVRVTSANDHVDFHVEDSGQGIARHDRSRVLEPFVRLRAPGRVDVEGSGLGLTIVRDIAQVHGAQLRLDDSPLGGLDAGLRFPTAPPT